MKSILEILQSVNEDVDYEVSNKYVSNGLLDSISLLGLITNLEENFDIEIPLEEISPENFDSIDAIALLVERLRGKHA